MQKLSLWVSAACCSLVLFSCTKSIESTPVAGPVEAQVVSSDVTTPTVVSCLIAKLVQDYSGFKNPAYFTYDAYKNPVSIVFTHGGTGNPSWYFKYDGQHRLVQLDKKYTNG